MKREGFVFVLKQVKYRPSFRSQELLARSLSCQHEYSRTPLLHSAVTSIDLEHLSFPNSHVDHPVSSRMQLVSTNPFELSIPMEMNHDVLPNHDPSPAICGLLTSHRTEKILGHFFLLQERVDHVAICCAANHGVLEMDFDVEAQEKRTAFCLNLRVFLRLICDQNLAHARNPF